MKQTLRFSTTISALAGALFVGADFLGDAAMADAPAPLYSQAEQQDVDRMEQHWQKLVRERDPQRRKVLIQEHRRLMEEVGRTTGIRPETQTGTRSAADSERKGMGGSHQREIMNTLDMHSMMLNMLE